MKLADIQKDWQVFAREGTRAVGAVRGVSAGRIDVYIEGYGDVVLGPEQVETVHDTKVVLAMAALSEELRAAIARAHDREDFRP